MKFSSTLLLSFTLALSSLSAREFSDHLPQGTLLVFEIENMGEKEAGKVSPFSETMKSIDWKELIINLFDQAVREGEMEDTDEEEPSPEEFKAAMDKFSQRMEEVGQHLNGSLVFAVGDLTSTIKTFMDVAEKRNALYDNDQLVRELSEEENEKRFKEWMEAETEFEAAEMVAVFSKLHFYAEVQDGEALMGKIETWLTELLQEQEDEEFILGLKKMEWAEGTVYTLVDETPAEDDEVQKNIPYPSLWWTVQDKVWIVAGTEQALRSSMESITNPNVNSLSASRSYQDSIDYLGEQDLSLYLDLSQLDSLIRTSLKDELDEVGPSGKSTGEILDLLGLDALLPYAMGFKEDMEGLHGKGRMGFSRPTMLSRMLIDPVEAEAPTPAFVHKDFPAVTSINWGLGSFLRRFEKEMIEVDPQFGNSLAGGKMMLATMLGLDVQTQFLDQLGSGMVMIQELDPEVSKKLMELSEGNDMQALMRFQMENPTGGQNLILAIEMKDQQAISSGLNTLLSRVHTQGLPEPVMFDGHPIYHPMPPTPGQGKMASLVTYTFLDSYMVIAIGNPEMLHKAIKATKDPGNQIWNTERYQDLRDKFPEADMMEFTQGSLQRAAFQSIQNSVNMLFDNPELAPDFSKIADRLNGVISTMVRKGTIFEFQTLSTFKVPE